MRPLCASRAEITLGFGHELSNGLVDKLYTARLQLGPFVIGDLELAAKTEHRQVTRVGAKQHHLLEAALRAAEDADPAVPNVVGVAGRAMAHDAAPDRPVEIGDGCLHFVCPGREEHRVRRDRPLLERRGKAAGPRILQPFGPTRQDLHAVASRLPAQPIQELGTWDAVRVTWAVT